MMKPRSDLTSRRRRPSAPLTLVLGLGLMTCSSGNDGGGTGIARVNVQGLLEGEATGGSVVISHSTTPTSPLSINVDPSGAAEAPSIPVGSVQVRYLPPMDYRVPPGQSDSRFGTISKGQAFVASFAVEPKTGSVRLNVSGLAPDAPDGGSAVLSRQDGPMTPISVAVDGSGFAQRTGVLTGTIKATYSAPDGHRPVPGAATEKEGVLAHNLVLPFSFQVEPTGGAVDVTVLGLAPGVTTGGEAVVSHADRLIDPVWIDLSPEGAGRASGIPAGEVEVLYHPPEAYSIAPGDVLSKTGTVTPPNSLALTYHVVPQLGGVRVEVSGLEEPVASGGRAVVLHVPGTVHPDTIQVDETGVGELATFPVGEVLVRYIPPQGYSLAPGDFGSKRISVASGEVELVPFQVIRNQPGITLRVTRLDGGQGTVLVTNGIPLRPGDLMPDDLGNVRLFVEGIEQAVHLSALRGRHLDGSLRALLVQFEYPVQWGTPLDGFLEWGDGLVRSLPDRAPEPAQATPAAVALPSDPNFLVATGITILPVMTDADVSAELSGTLFGSARTVFRQYSTEHWNVYGADYSQTTNLYDRALSHFTYWAMTGETVYWERAVANSLEARRGSTDTPQTSAVAPRFYQPDGMAIHYLLTGDETSIDFIVGGLIRMSLMAGHNPSNLARFGIPPVGYEYNEGRIRARILLGHLWAWIFGDTEADWGARADAIVQGMIDGQNADGSFTYRLGTDNTSQANLRYGQSNFMEGMAMDALAKYYHLRSANPEIVTVVQGMVDFLNTNEWDDNGQTWHYWSPSTAWDRGDSEVPLHHIDGLNTMLTIGHYWTDHIRGTSINRARADAAWIQAFGSEGAAFDITWGKKNFNQVFLNAFPQLFFRQR